MRIPKWQIKRRCKDPKYLVVVTCQGCPFYYQHRNLVSALFGFAWQYGRTKRYGTCNFKLREVSFLDEFEGEES